MNLSEHNVAIKVMDIEMDVYPSVGWIGYVYRRAQGGSFNELFFSLVASQQGKAWGLQRERRASALLGICRGCQAEQTGTKHRHGGHVNLSEHYVNIKVMDGMGKKSCVRWKTVEMKLLDLLAVLQGALSSNLPMTPLNGYFATSPTISLTTYKRGGTILRFRTWHWFEAVV